MTKKKTVLFSLMMGVGGALVFAADTATVTLYNTKCASCHGKNGKGSPAIAKMLKLDPALLDLTDKATLDKKDADLNALTTKGIGKMPAYGEKLKLEEIHALTEYIRQLSKATV